MGTSVQLVHPEFAGPHHAHVWFLSTDVSLDESRRFWTSLSHEEKNRAQRFKFQIDRDRFVAAHGALRMILRAYCGLPAESLEFSAGEYGKPRLLSKTPPIAFNLSHSAGCALIAVTSGSECGVDIEKIQSGRSEEEIAERFFSERENEWLGALPSDRRTEGFFRIWARKEAVIKATGRGLSLPLREVDVISAVESKFWVSDLNICEGFASAIAVEGPPHEVCVIQETREGPFQYHPATNRGSSE